MARPKDETALNKFFDNRLFSSAYHSGRSGKTGFAPHGKRVLGARGSQPYRWIAFVAFALSAGGCNQQVDGPSWQGDDPTASSSSALTTVAAAKKGPDAPCVKGDECASGICFRTSENAAACVAPCGTDDECPNGQVCEHWNMVGAKTQFCSPQPTRPRLTAERRVSLEGKPFRVVDGPPVVETGSTNVPSRSREAIEGGVP